MKTTDKYSGLMIAGAAVLLVLYLGMTGCVGYNVGSMLPAKYKTVAVPTFVNQTGEPLLENPTTSAVIGEIQVDGSLRIADSNTADTILKVTLIDFDMRPIAFSQERARLADEYRMNITTKFVLSDRRTGEVVAESASVHGYSDFVVSGDLTSSKQTVLPKASEDLAQRIVEKLVETW